MSLVVNHNLMAANSSRYLNTHYKALSDSTRKLSSGLRVETAADDAAGLAIRELMRADIAALNQGVRNANDGISLIQTADGALGVIDEKLVRMKELAEQAATGTYDSTQRLIIDSEYQQMASEITRIANATDFNGIKLLDGSLSGTHDGEVRGVGDTGDFRRHLLIFGFNNQTLGGVIGAGGGLFRKFLHADQLFIDDLKSAVGGLDEGNAVIGIADTLIKGADFRAHEFADGETGGIIRSGFHAEAGRQFAGGIGKLAIVGVQVTRGVHRHHVVIDDQRHNFHPP